MQCVHNSLCHVYVHNNNNNNVMYVCICFLHSTVMESTYAAQPGASFYSSTIMHVSHVYDVYMQTT